MSVVSTKRLECESRRRNRALRPPTHGWFAAFRAATSALLAGVASAALWLVGPTAPANAAHTVICRGYDSCAARGWTHYGYKSARVNSYWRMCAPSIPECNMSTGNNCTNYVAFRFVTRKYDAMSNTRPWSGDGNAYSWGRLNPSKTNSTPRVGAVAWWDANRSPASSDGHVAYVEKVVSSSEIWISESNWGGTDTDLGFRWIKVTSGTGWPSGFIHFKDERILATVAPKISGTPKVGVRLTAGKGTWVSSSGNHAPRNRELQVPMAR